ncbi:MAG: thymidine phosphorylase family protein [Pseudomonadota bacterium]|nr:thymidine phosphorylase family protein [Pseudomonadota bacterium]
MNEKPTLILKRLGIDTQNEAVIYMRNDSHICLSEGFVSQARIRVQKGERYIIATLNTVTTPLLHHNEAGLSEYAWQLLEAKEGEEVSLSHPKPLHSLSYIRSKIYGNVLKEQEINAIIEDAVAGHLSDIHTSAFVAACAGGRLNEEEIFYLTHAMAAAGELLSWGKELVVDKHCVGGLPGNRTTPIVVAIVAAYGLIMPKTSSRSITSPAGTADTMEVLAPVELSLDQIRKVVEKENGCIAWGGAVSLSPADDVLIRVERALNVDSEGQLVASVLSKKIAAGSTHVVIDIPIGPTAKVRDASMGIRLQHLLRHVGKLSGLTIKVVLTEGFEPVGRGIGPALEARDVVQVLTNHQDAPADLREHALLLAGNVLEFSPAIERGKGIAIAEDLLRNGKAWAKFQAICEAQGGMREIPQSCCRHDYLAEKTGKITQIDTRRIALLAKLAGAPQFKAAGVDLHVKLHAIVEKGQPLFTIHSQSSGELNYALSFLHESNELIRLEEME